MSENDRGQSNDVSVIIPAYNAAPFLAETLESVLAQTVPASEIIVVDDGSTDGTGEIAKSYEPRVNVVTQANRGVTVARNAGAAAAQGAWLAFLDADDLWEPAKLQRQLEAASETGASLVYTNRYNLGARGDLPHVQSDIQPPYEGDVFLDLMLRGNYITISSVLVKANVFRDVGGFEFENIQGAEDWHLWIRVAERHRVAACKDPLVHYRFHETMMSGDPRKMQRARMLAIEDALTLPRSRSLPWPVRSRIRSMTAQTNANDARRRGFRTLAAREYFLAWKHWPLNRSVYGDVVRLLVGRQ